MPSTGIAFLLPTTVNERSGHAEPLEQRQKVSFSPSILRRWPNGKPSRRYFPRGRRCEASFAGESQQQHNVVITERLFTAFHPALRLQDLGQTGSLRFSCGTPACVSVVPYIRQIGGAERAEPAHGNAKVTVLRVPGPRSGAVERCDIHLHIVISGD